MSSVMKDDGAIEVTPRYGGPPVVFDLNRLSEWWRLFKWLVRYYHTWHHDPLGPMYDERGKPLKEYE